MIGVLVIDIEGAYSKMIWQEVGRHTRSRGYDLLLLPANNPKCPYKFRSQFNSLYNFIQSSVIDALIFVPSILGNFLYAEESDRLIDDIRKAVPVVSLNTLIDGVPSLLIDNETGIDAAVRHCVDVHGYQRIGFLEGPQDNHEASERKSAYFSALKRIGIDPMPNWVIPCDFTTESAEALGDYAGANLVDNLDALIAANDYMALGLLKSLARQGYDIPSDLAVIGFDDIREAPFLRPPLTTIQQPFTKLANRAARLAIDICEGRQVNLIEQFDTELVIRASCGCDDYIYEDILRTPVIEIHSSPKRCLQQFLKKHYAQLVADRLSEPAWTLLDFLLTRDVSEPNKRRFLKDLAKTLDREFFEFDTDSDWSRIFSFIIDYMLVNDKDKLEKWHKIYLFERSRYLINRKQKLWNGYKNFRRHETHTVPLRQTIENLSLVQNRAEMVDVLKNHLPQLDVRNCLITLFEEGDLSAGLYSSLPTCSRMVLAYQDNAKITVSTNDAVVFPTLDLWPRHFAPSPNGNVWVVGPLFNRDKLYGFIISDIADFDSGINESLRHQLSITLHSCYLSNERDKAESRLRGLLGELSQNNRKLKKESLFDEMTGLLNRRGFKKRMAELLSHYGHGNVSYALFFADMDGLKQINDNLGHSEGDRAIVDMARIFRRIFRSGDVVARFGGDEFAAFTLNVPNDFKSKIDVRVKTLIDRFNAMEERPYHLSFSIGAITNRLNERPLDLNTVLKQADDKLYEQKRARKTLIERDSAQNKG